MIEKERLFGAESSTKVAAGQRKIVMDGKSENRGCIDQRDLEIRGYARLGGLREEKDFSKWKLKV